MRLIDADDLLTDPYFQDESIPERVMFIEAVDDSHTIDAVPVVRCKDCQAWQQNSWNKGEMVCKCWADWLPTEPDDFCSYGQRKDGAADGE